MHEIREIERLVRERLMQLETPINADREARLLADAAEAVRKERPQPVPMGRAIASAVGRSRAAGLAAAVAAVVLIVVIAGKVSRPVWALDQVIVAMQSQKACNLTMIDAGGVVYDIWAKAEPSGELSDEVTVKGSNGTAVWVKNNSTYYFDPRSNTVEVDDAKTAGFSPWLGPELMRMIEKADDVNTAYGKDPATGREVVAMTGNMMTVSGRISWSIEFDRESKLPVSFRQWNNPQRSGPPTASIVRIVYYRTVPQGVLSVVVPAGVSFREKPIVLPEANLSLMTNPNQGIPAEGMSHAQAARKILGLVYQASIDGDLATIRRLCPLTANWSDELLRVVILNEETGRRLAEVVDIGAVSREGVNRVGPFVVVPTRLKTIDGRLWDEKQIVQFRQIGGRDSCVLYGPYGMISEVK